MEGTCPHCNFTPARGDQCDNCGRLLDPTDLIAPYSAISGSRNIEVRETRHLYLLQTKLCLLYTSLGRRARAAKPRQRLTVNVYRAWPCLWCRSG